MANRSAACPTISSGGQEFVGKVPVPVIVFLLFVIVAFIILRFSQYGRWIYALRRQRGGRAPLRLNTNWLITSVYGISGFCAGVAGFLLTARLIFGRAGRRPGGRAAGHRRGGDLGHEPFGGEGTVIGTFIGALLIGVLNNGL